MTHLPPRPIATGSRPARPAARRRLRWAWLLSLLLHLLPVVFLLLLMPAHRLPEPLPDPGFAVVFEGGTGEETKSTETGPLPTPQAPTPEAAPEPPAQQAEAAPEPEPARPEPPQPEAQPAGPEPQAAEPPPGSPPVRQAQEAPRVSPFPAPEEESADAPPFTAEPFRMPEAPPPLPPAPPRPRGTWAGVPVLPSNPFAASRPAPAAPRPPQRGLDLALGPVMPAPRMGGGQGAPDSTMSLRGAENLGADWRALFRAWLERHSRYPQEAAMMGQDGPVTVRFTMDRYGKVGSVELIRRSGSMYLDAATLGLLRGQTLPPFPPGTQQDGAEIDLTINYILVRR